VEELLPGRSEGNLIYLACYALSLCILVLSREWGQRSTLDRFLVADRKVGGLIGSMSIAASWIWAPAIFISIQTGYTWGFSGLIWFIIPNMLALVIFAPLAERVRRSIPDGYSYIEYTRRGDVSFTITQLTLQLIIQVVIFALQLVAGAELLSTLTGTEYHWMVVGMALTPLCYTLFSGLRTSVFTDAIQYVVIVLSAAAIFFAFPSASIILETRPFNPVSHSMLLEFGLSSALGLVVAIFADHQQWQRAFAIKCGEVSRTFYIAAFLHGLVTGLLGAVGCLIYSIGYKPARIDLVGIEFISSNYAPIFVPIFVVMAMCALISTLDSSLCAFSGLATKELCSSRQSLRNARTWMAVLVAGAIAVALLRPALLTLWFIASTIRLSSFAPTILSTIGAKSPSRLDTVGIVAALFIGGSVFAYGIYFENPTVRTIGMALSLLTPVFILLAKYWRGNQQVYSAEFADRIKSL